MLQLDDLTGRGKKRNGHHLQALHQAIWYRSTRMEDWIINEKI